MAGAAGVFFLLSFGPKLTLGDRMHLVAKTTNPVYMLCHDCLPFLSAFRVVSRFGVIALFAALCTAAVSLDRLLAARPRLPPGAKAALCALLLAAVSVEAVPSRRQITSYVPIVDQRASPAIARLVAEHPVRTIAAVPMGPRRLEGDRMFTMLKGDFPYVYAWGGFFPEWSMNLQGLATRFDADGFRHELAKLFPEALLVVDTACAVRIDPIDRELPPGTILRETEPGRLALVDWEKVYAGVATLRDRDGRFLLFDLVPDPPAPEVGKLFRSDVARGNPVVCAEIAAEPGARVAATLNGAPAASGLGPGEAVFELSPDLLRRLEKAAPNSLVFRSEDGSPIAVRAFRMEGRDGAYHDPCAPYSPARATPPSNP